MQNLKLILSNLPDPVNWKWIGLSVFPKSEYGFKESVRYLFYESNRHPDHALRIIIGMFGNIESYIVQQRIYIDPETQSKIGVFTHGTQSLYCTC